jgi:uncharacterized membrane protein
MNLLKPAAKASTVFQRDQLADFLRGVAVVLMIQVNLMELFATEAILKSWIGKISLLLGGAPAAPVFMIIMGYYAARTRKSFHQQILRGIRLFFGGLLLNVGLNISLLWKVIRKEFTLDPFQYIFGADILQLAGLSLIVLALIKKYLNEKLILHLILLIIVLLISEIVSHIKMEFSSTSKYILSFFFGVSEWSYFPFFPWFAYPLIGFIICDAREKSFLMKLLSNRNLKIILLVTLIILYPTFDWSISISSDLQSYYHHGILFFIWCFTFLIGWTIIFYFINNLVNMGMISSFVQWLGINVTAVYAFQWLLIGNIATHVYKSQGIIQIAGWFIAILLLTSILTYLWKMYRT